MFLSIVPKTFLHDVFAHHTDVTACNDVDLTSPCIHKQGYNCQQTDIVVPLAYTPGDASVKIIADVETVPLISFSTSYLKNSHSAISGRGPPFYV